MTGRQNLRIGWVGFHTEGELAFKALVDHGYHIVGAVTLNEEAVEKRSAASNYLEQCFSLNIPLHKTPHINNDDTFTWLLSINIDLLIVLGWSQILSPQLLSVAKIGAIGAHASLLPELRGSAPLNWAIIRGLRKTGNSLIELVADVDHGKIIDQVSFEITQFDTCKSLYDKVALSNAEMLLRSIPQIAAARQIIGTHQISTSEPLLPRRKPADGKIDWSQSAQAIYDLIRAVTKPYPGAFTFLGSEKVMIWSASIVNVSAIEINAKPGTLLGPIYSTQKSACGWVVLCGNNSLIVLNELEIDRSYRGIDLIELSLNGLVFGE